MTSATIVNIHTFLQSRTQGYTISIAGRCCGAVARLSSQTESPLAPRMSAITLPLRLLSWHVAVVCRKVKIMGTAPTDSPRDFSRRRCPAPRCDRSTRCDPTNLKECTCSTRPSDSTVSVHRWTTGLMTSSFAQFHFNQRSNHH